MQIQTVGPQAQSPTPPPGFPKSGRGRTRLARVSREQEKLAAKAAPVPAIVQPHIARKNGKLDPSILCRSADPTTLLAMAAVLVLQNRRKHRTELMELYEDLLEGNLSDETVLRHVVEMPFERKKVDVSGVLVAAVQLCREHCLKRVFWQEKGADIAELGRSGMLDLNTALQELNDFDNTASEIENK